MLAANNNYKIGDENEEVAVNSKLVVKKAGGGGGGVVAANTEVNKRAALSQIQNRANVGNAAAKEAVQKEVKEVIKLQNAFRGVKARVDSHWKKPTDGETATAGTAVVQRKQIVRTTSMRLANEIALKTTKATTVTTTTTTTTTTATANIQSYKGLEKTKSTTTGIVTAANTVVTATAKAFGTKVQRSKDTKAEPKEPNSNLAKSELNKVVKQSKSDIKTEVILPVQSLSIQSIDGVKDIDEDDADKLMLVSEYANDIYDYLFDLEEKQPIQKNFLDGQLEVHPKMRAVLIDWINEVHLQFHLIVETFQLTVAIVDRYLQLVKTTKRTQFQLLGVTALFVASKYEELLPPAIADVIFITDDTYNEKQVRQMELEILKALKFELSRPLPIHFLRRFSKAADADSSHHSLAKYFLELSLMEYDLCHFKPSEIAAASLYLSLNLLKSNHQIPTGLKSKYWTTTLQHYSRYTATHLKPIAKKIARTTYNAPSAKLKAIYTKFRLAKFQKVAMLPQLYSPLMTSIINSEN